MLEEKAKKFAYNSIYANLKTWGLSDFQIKQYMLRHRNLLKRAEKNYLKGMEKAYLNKTVKRREVVAE